MSLLIWWKPKLKSKMRKIDIWSADFGWRVVHSAHSSDSKVQPPPHLADCVCAKKLPPGCKVWSCICNMMMTFWSCTAVSRAPQILIAMKTWQVLSTHLDPYQAQAFACNKHSKLPGPHQVAKMCKLTIRQPCFGYFDEAHNVWDRGSTLPGSNSLWCLCCLSRPLLFH